MDPDLGKKGFSGFVGSGSESFDREMNPVVDLLLIRIRNTGLNNLFHQPSTMPSLSEGNMRIDY